MPSPFPGMNPYLEQDDLWKDFHQSFIPLVREALNTQVRPGYIARIEEYLFIHELSEDERIYLGRSDVSLAFSPAWRRYDRRGNVTSAATAAPSRRCRLGPTVPPRAS